MAGGDTGFEFSRAATELVNRNKIRPVFDFAFGQFLAWDTFFEELSRIQSGIINNDGIVELKTGQLADVQTVGGALAISIYMEALETTKESMVGLAKLGLKNENRLWQLQ